jgi:hypothetical protein
MYFHRHITPPHSVGFKQFLNQFSEFERSVVDQKVINNKSECFPRCLLSFFYEFMKIPLVLKVFCLRTDKDFFFYLWIADLRKILLQIIIIALMKKAENT